ncbi:hypothetical protein EUQ87_10480 [Salmonella enterica subsp. enterica]|nr:hypothetical protein [Salmonella enterica subsp. enterica serovar Enteritidis]ECI6923842.1 hypothetical protein [Salmonella enterica subsp. enterica]ECJ5067386.1 hypothetical protein [Salmonella enterica subsp. enterica]
MPAHLRCALCLGAPVLPNLRARIRRPGKHSATGRQCLAFNPFTTQIIVVVAAEVHHALRRNFNDLKKRGIEFVVASGNQYYQLISLFPELKDEISFVAENGALVYEHDKQLFHGELT